MSKRLGLLVALILVASLLAACGGGGGSSSTSSSTSSSSSSSSSSSGSATRIEIAAAEFRFTPNTLTVNRGTTVELVLKNEGSIPHDLRIEGLNVQTPAVQANASTSVTFTPSQAGEYKVYCTVPGHEAAGMVATLRVN